MIETTITHPRVETDQEGDRGIATNAAEVTAETGFIDDMTLAMIAGSVISRTNLRSENETTAETVPQPEILL
jgi:hypothetical protein